MNFVELKNNVAVISNFFLDLIFPKKCVNCGEFGSFCCQKCLDNIKPIQTQVCPKCGKISDKGKWCAGCKGKSNLAGIIVGAQYRVGPTKEVIHYLKYNGVVENAPLLANLLIDQILDAEFPENTVITAVPLHKKRYLERGFNQAGILAKIVAEKTGIPYQNLLVRNKYIESQVKSTGQKRRENLVGAFSLISNIDTKNLNIILVDDVSTTGATIEECAKTLRESGVRQVWGLVVARA